MNGRRYCVCGNGAQRRGCGCVHVSVLRYNEPRDKGLLEVVFHSSAVFVAKEILYVCVCARGSEAVGVLCKYACIYLCSPLFAIEG